MICAECEDAEHYWFADGFLLDGEHEGQASDPELEKLIGKYAWCDMREVYRLSTPCECGCHQGGSHEKNTTT